jgi:alpha-ketoglutarate-dependent taurine dioxygenase
MTTTTLNYTIETLTPHTGAEVHGVDLREPVDTATAQKRNRSLCGS